MNALKTVAELMEVAARTAPKTQGWDYVVTKTIEADEVRKLGEAMIAHAERLGETDPHHGYLRDGRNTRDSDIVVLIGIKDAAVPGFNCGACGSEKCIKINTFEADFQGPQCPFRVLDMGIALGSAVKMAGIMNVDNRIMYRTGLVARTAGFIDADYVMGIPMSSRGKSIYFDR